MRSGSGVVTPEGFRGPFFKQNSGPKPRQEARWSHHRIGDLPLPQRVGEKRVYSTEDVERIRRYFTEREERCLPKKQ
jgi:hypothetical protein